MSSNIEIMQVNAPRIGEIWGAILPGLQKSMENSGNHVGADSIFDNLVSNIWSLFLVVDGEHLMGGGITEVRILNDGVWLNVPFGWSEDPNVDVHPEFFGHIEKLARDRGFKGIQFISSRKGYGRKAKKLGFERGFIEYRKEF